MMGYAALWRRFPARGDRRVLARRDIGVGKQCRSSGSAWIFKRAGRGTYECGDRCVEARCLSTIHRKDWRRRVWAHAGWDLEEEWCKRRWNHVRPRSEDDAGLRNSPRRRQERVYVLPEP
ncbi:hypothetical protein U1Q18_028572 [Sarracenia purpurea var. burkii]